MKITDKIVTSKIQPQQTNVVWHNPETGETITYGEATTYFGYSDGKIIEQFDDKIIYFDNDESPLIECKDQNITIYRDGEPWIKSDENNMYTHYWNQVPVIEITSDQCRYYAPDSQGMPMLMGTSYEDQQQSVYLNYPTSEVYAVRLHTDHRTDAPSESKGNCLELKATNTVTIAINDTKLVLDETKLQKLKALLEE